LIDREILAIDATKKCYSNKTWGAYPRKPKAKNTAINLIDDMTVRFVNKSLKS